MKYLLLLLLPLLSVSCSEPEPSSAIEQNDDQPVNIEAEVAAIEDLRQAFTKAIDEKRYSDLGQYTHPDLISIGPGSEDWKRYRKLREEQSGLFSYDSIRMRPYETMLVNDSMAYDFGWSSVYYTDPDGKPVEIVDTFLLLLKKGKDGKWRLWREVASARVDDLDI